jgi:LmbE family N-acetylglucosaminyl deacetylase
MRLRRLLCILGLTATALAQQSGQPLPMDTGRPGIEQMLTKLRTTARLMQITAHPDDEDGSMMALEARGHGVTVELFTLTRGDGGQNKTGSSFSDELGILRTLELLESGRYFGVQQRFSRVADFGFSKTPEETFQKWGGHQVPLADLVRAIRTFRPDVVAPRFSGTPRDGHGHHQASGILAREAVIAAADPSQFPEQIKEGLLPWKVSKLYHDVIPPGEKNIASMDAGVKLPYLDRSFAELGSEGYSHQKSQNATYSPPPPGPNLRRYKLIWPTEGTKDETDLFDGIEVRFDHLFDRLSPGERGLLKTDQAKLEEAAKQIDLAEAAFKKNQISAAVPFLRGREIVNAILDDVKNSQLSPDSKSNLGLVLGEKAQQFQTAANLALGLKLSASPASVQPVPFFVPGSTHDVGVTLEHAPAQLKIVDVDLQLPSGWNSKKLDRKFASKSAGYRRSDFTVNVPAEAELTRPFWHRDDPSQSAYATLPLPPPPIKATVIYSLQGLPGEITAVATTAPGKRRALAVEPAFSLAFASSTRVVPITQAQHFTFDLATTKYSDGAADGTIDITLPKGWTAEVSNPKLHWTNAQPQQSVTVSASADSSEEGTYELRASLSAAGRTYSEGFTEVARDDLDHFFYFHPAVERVSIVDVKLPKVLRLCYVPGAGDDVAGVLNQLGMNVKQLPAGNISAENLKNCDTVILGIRAYDTQTALRDKNKLLLDFVHDGGTLLVQNNFSVEDFNGAHLTPFDAQLGRQRVSDETAAVTVQDANSPLLHFPNQIAEKDFNGWVQERGVNFMSTWSKDFHPLLCSHDPGEQPLCGGLLTAQYGKGTYIYTGYSFFRQLPAGVPGAIRLFVNLVSAGHAAN